MNATLTIQVRVIGAQATSQLRQVQQAVEEVQSAGSAGAGGGFLASMSSGWNAFVGGIQSGIGMVQSALGSVSSLFGNWANNLSRVGRQMTMGFTLPLALGVKTVTGWAMENQRAMTQVIKVYGDGTEAASTLKAETDALAESFKLLSEVYGQNQADVINIGAAWAAAGLKQEALASATETTLQVMTLGDMDADKTVQSIMSIAAAYQLSFKTMDNGMSEVSDAMAIFNAIENQTGATFADLIDGAQRSASAARAAGIDIEHLGAMIAALTPTTGSGAAAGNAIKSIVSRIMTPTKQTQQILEKIGIDISGKQWNNSTALQKIQQIADKVSGLDQVTKNWVDSTVAGRWQLNRFSQLMQDLSTSAGMYTKAVNASDSVTKRQTTYWNELTKVLESNPKKFEILSNIMKNELADLGVQAMPVLLAIMNALRQLLEWFNNLSPKTKSFVLSFLAITAAVGPVLIILSTLFRVLEGFFGALSFGVGAIKLLVNGIGGLGNILFILVQTLASVGGAIVNVVSSVIIPSVMSIAAAAWDMTTSAIAALVSMTVAFVTSAYESAAALVSMLIPAIAASIGWIMEMAGAATLGAINTLVAAIGLFSVPLADAVAGFAAFAIGGVAAAVEVSVAWVSGLLPALMGAIETFFASIGPIVGEAVLGVVQGIVNIATAISPELGAMAVNFFATVIDGVAGLFATLGGFLTGAVEAIGAAVGAIAVAVGLPVEAVVAIIVAAIALLVVTIIAIFNKGFRDKIIDAVKWIIDAVWAIPKTFGNMLVSLVGILKTGIQKVMDLLSYLNPFARHSPSLVDNVRAGVRVILDEYAKLKAIPPLVVSAANAHDAFTKATMGAKKRLDDADTAQQRATVAKQAPEALPAFNQMVIAKTNLQNSVPALTQQIAQQAQVVQKLQQSYDQASAVLKAHQRVLDDLQYRYDKLGAAIDAAQSRIDTLLDTPITGLTKMEDAIYQNELAQKKLKLSIMDLEDAGQTIDDLTSKFADLGGEIESLQGVRNDLYLKGAGSDVLKVYDDQIKAIQDQRKQLQGQTSDLQDLTDQLNALEREGEKLDLQKALTFDDQLHTLQQMSKTVEEMPFDEIVKEIQQQKSIVDSLSPSYNELGKQIDQEKSTITDIQYLHDAIGDRLDDEKAKLQDLEDAYSDIQSLIQSMDSDLSDLVGRLDSAAQKAKQLADSALPTGNYDIPGGNEPLFDEQGSLAGIDDFNKQLQKKLQDAMKGMPDPFEGLKKKLGSLKETFSNVIWSIRDFFSHVWDILSGWGWNIAGWGGDVIQWFKDLPGRILGALQALPGIIGTLASMAGSLIMGFLGGLISALPGLMQWFLDLPGVILSWLPGAISWLWYTGLDIISGMSNGIFNGAIAIAVFFIKLPGMILDWIGNAASWLIGKGMDIISGMWGGLLKALPAIMTFFIQLPGKVVSWIGDALSWLWQKGQDIISGLWNGVQFLYTWLRTNIGNIPGWVTGALGDATQWLVQKGKDIVTGLWNGIKSMDRWFYDRIMEFFKAIIPDPLEKFFGIGSPSKLMAEYGVYISQGLANGLLDSKDLTVQAATTVAEAVSQALTLDPTMTAALDVQANVVGLPSSMDLATMTSQVATGTAQLVATSTTQVIEQTIQRQLSGPQVGPTDQGGWGYVPQQQDPQPVVVQLPEGAMGNETTIHIDSLVLPNIQSSADAQALLDNLKALTDD